MEALTAAMVLMTYSSVHAHSLLAETTTDEEGRFELASEAPGTLTLLIESANCQGSYHQKRYDMQVLNPAHSSSEPMTDFGVSHLEGHEEIPPLPARSGLGGK